MKLLKSLFVVALFSSPAAFAQQGTDRSLALVAALASPHNQWVFNHICVPVAALPGSGYINRDFVDAYYKVTEMRWAAAMAAKANGDEKASMQQLALILHGVIDAYWPGRVERDGSGAITAFRDCASLGNLPGVLSEERYGGPDNETQERIVKLETAVIVQWKNSTPFDEVKAVLESGPMKLSASHAGSPLVQNPS